MLQKNQPFLAEATRCLGLLYFHADSLVNNTEIGALNSQTWRLCEYCISDKFWYLQYIAMRIMERSRRINYSFVYLIPIDIHICKQSMLICLWRIQRVVIMVINAEQWIQQHTVRHFNRTRYWISVNNICKQKCFEKLEKPITKQELN
jgi:hypothetical protein